MTNEIINQLLHLFIAFKEYSLKANGWKSESYLDDSVWCYFATDSDHTLVRIEKIEIAFYNFPMIYLPIKMLGNIGLIINLINTYSVKLMDLEKEYNERPIQELEVQRLNEINILENRILELKSTK